ncbi:NADH dehydrogenase subunit E [Alkalispirillum mobile]|uniref:NADH-quinone oxidoreductase subunit E n=1 Tax=Alkalispirillum mobile TaxID=85925 RepID=A0A498C4W8_9GAMM|nr:NADH-quinone oxidoreductase subunit NuoE [Alkalispirillum mobile]RLK50825.1 NADH dehydrogenase subunit E [Alkalispirillum mobile]
MSSGLAEQLLTPEMRAEIDHWLTKYPDDQKQSAVIPALHVVQDNTGGWLRREYMDAVAEYLEMDPVAVYEVATFYSMFDLEPVGRHKVNICTNICCWLKGAEDIVAYTEKKLGIKLGETTADDRITLKIEEECLAACTGAPMMVVDGHYYTDLTPEKIDQILDALE